MTPDDTSNIPQNADGVAKRVLDRIDREHMRPIARSHFILQNLLLWAFGAVSIVFGAVAAAAALFAIANAGWRYYVATHDNLLTFIVQTAPFVWLITFAIFVLVGYEIFKRTKSGYKYPFFAVALGSIVLSLLLGVGLYAFGLGEVFDDALGAVPFYHPTIATEESLWSHPEKGLLAGRVVSLAPDFSSFTLLSFDGSLWTVDGDDLRHFDETALARGGLVRVVGVPFTGTTTTNIATTTATSTDATAFHACFVFPWEVYGGFGANHLDMPFMHLLGERNDSAERSSECKDVRPYAPLRALEEDGEASSSPSSSGS
jgi:hypothetical protein